MSLRYPSVVLSMTILTIVFLRKVCPDPAAVTTWMAWYAPLCNYILASIDVQACICMKIRPYTLLNSRVLGVLLWLLPCVFYGLSAIAFSATSPIVTILAWGTVAGCIFYAVGVIALTVLLFIGSPQVVERMNKNHLSSKES